MEYGDSIEKGKKPELDYADNASALRTLFQKAMQKRGGKLADLELTQFAVQFAKE